MAKKKFTVSFYHRAYYDVAVEAETEEEAITLAEKKWETTDFGPDLIYADGGLYSCTNENDEVTYFK